MFFFAGCGILQSISTSTLHCDKRVKSLDPFHIHSCGPVALEKAMRYSEHNSLASRANYSYYLQSKDFFLRDCLSVFDERARSITFPGEIRMILDKEDISFRTLKKLGEIQSDDVALVLVKENWSLTYHWMCYPVDKNISTYFGEGDTTILEIYAFKFRR
jgi:hypothetical protein|tara:strand:- start:54 stop:533 length:480 start_codon:yes stop_codon:yes gene_type:complete